VVVADRQVSHHLQQQAVQGLRHKVLLVALETLITQRTEMAAVVAVQAQSVQMPQLVQLETVVQERQAVLLDQR
jgi:hypothetical protein